VLGIDEVAILKLQNVMDTNLGARGAGPGGPGAAAYAQYCSACHGANLQNPLPGIPNLTGVTNRVAEDVIHTIVTNGGGNMRPVPGITDLEINAIVEYLVSGGRAGGAGAGRGRGGAATTETYPPGPVVQTGGAPVPTVPTRAGGSFGGRGPTGGDVPYPEDANDAPKARYSTGYNVMGTSTAPPYSRLTAYDLNTGTIKWQVPVGDHPATIARGGPTNTGSVGLRTGIMPTKAGIVFLAGGDGKLRAYDEDNGQVLWTGELGGSGRGIPVIYMSKGRQYLVVVAQPSAGRAGGGGGRGPAPGLSAGTNQPRGFVAFALPAK
jgi:quinoprotein glucose dehydrogenase